jgi:hypothetical protein
MRQLLVALAAVLFLAATARAEPVRCSNELKACVAACGALPPGQRSSPCNTACQVRMNVCRQTGCWDKGGSRYCGLLRQ